MSVRNPGQPNPFILSVPLKTGQGILAKANKNEIKKVRIKLFVTYRFY
jgi:hypothetical protein